MGPFCWVFHPIVALIALGVYPTACHHHFPLELSSEVEQPKYYKMGERPDYIQYYSSAEIIRDDLIPMKNTFPNYQRPRSKLGYKPPLDDVISTFDNIWSEPESKPAGPPQGVHKIRYFVRWKSPSPMWSSIQDKGFNLKEHWHVGGPVKILIHGFTPNSDITPEERIKGQLMFDIGNGYLAKTMTNNIIVMDWTSLTTHNYLKYYKAAESVKDAAQDLASLLLWLRYELGLITDWQDIHLIGFSLGAHVAGGAGRLIVNEIGYAIGRISGIDPAGPKFHEDGYLPRNKDNVLDSRDAEFVDVIHCNMGKNIFGLGYFGTPAQSGHADFYPNGGEKQNGCSYFQNQVGCSHIKCPEIFLKTIHEKSLACPCTSWKRFGKGLCTCTIGSGGVYMGAHVSLSDGIRYYLPWA